MPLLNLKEYLKPNTPEEAIEFLSSRRGKAKIVAGGITIHEFAERGLLSHIEALIDIENIGLSYVRKDADRVRIGSTSVIADLLNEDVFFHPSLMALYDSFKNVKPVQIRNVATIGGEICSAIPFFDVPIALCALGAKLKILGPNGDRTGDIRKFFLNMFTPDLRDDELLLEVILPRESKNTASSFLKIGRTAYDYGVVSVATKIRLDEDGRCIGANVYFGNVDIVPYRAEEAEGMLKGKFIDKEVIERAMDMVPRIEPSPTIHASSEYKKEVMKVLLRDSLRIALDRVSKRCDL